MSKIIHIMGKNIRRFRRAKGITQEKLAETVDVSGSYIGYLERGKKSPSLDLLARIANVLQVDPATLLTETDDTKNAELNKLSVILSDKRPEAIKFISEVAIAYFKSLDSFKS